MSWYIGPGGRPMYIDDDAEQSAVNRDFARAFAEAFRTEMRQPSIRRIIEADRQKRQLEQTQIAPVKFLDD